MLRADDIETRLVAAFQPSEVKVQDDSARHAGHAAMKGQRAGSTHYVVSVVSESFRDKSRVERHRVVNECLKDLFAEGLHALTIHATAPGEKRHPEGRDPRRTR